MQNPFDEKLGEQRMEICRKCEFIGVGDTVCKVCGCILYFKTRFKETECPKKKW